METAEESAHHAHGSRWARLAALWALAENLEADDVAVTLLIDVLERAEADAMERTAAADALFLLVDRHTTIVPLLLERLHHPDPEARWRVVWILGRLQPPPEAVVAAVLACLRDPAMVVRERAATALGKFRISSPVVIAALLDAVAPKLKVRAEDTLAPNGEGSAANDVRDAMGNLTLASRTEPEETPEDTRLGVDWAYDDLRDLAAEALDKIDACTPEVLGALLDSYSEFHCRGGQQGYHVFHAARQLVARSAVLRETVRTWATDKEHECSDYAEQISFTYPVPIGSESTVDSAVPALTAEAEETMPDTAVEAVDALLALLHMALEPGLLERIARADRQLDDIYGTPHQTYLPITACELVALARRSPSARAALLARLPDESAPLRAVVATLLAYPPAALIGMWCGSVYQLPRHSSYTRLAGEEMRPILLALLKDHDVVVRWLALGGLATLDGAELLQPAMASLLEEGKYIPHLDWWNAADVVRVVARTLDSVGNATVALLEALRPQSTLRTRAASRALVRNTPISREGVAVLLRHLQRPEGTMDRLHLHAQNDRGPMQPGFLIIDDPQIVQALLQIVANRTAVQQSRANAISLLKLIGSTEPAVLDTLHRCLHDPNEFLRVHALDALLTISGATSTNYAALEDALSIGERFVREAALKLAIGLESVPLSIFDKIRDLIGSTVDEGSFVMSRSTLSTAFVSLHITDPGSSDRWRPLLTDTNPGIQLTAAKLLIALGAADRAVTDTLLSRLTDDRYVLIALELLGKHGDSASRVIDALLVLLTRGDYWLGNAALVTLGCLGAGNRAVLEAIYARLEAYETLYPGDHSENPEARALIALARADAECAAILRRRLTARFTDLPDRLPRVLRILPDAEVVRVVLLCLQRGIGDAGWNRRQEVAVLASVRSEAPEVTAALCDHLRTTADARLQALAIDWLGKRGLADSELVDAIIETQAARAPWLQAAAAAALGAVHCTDAILQARIRDYLIGALADANLEVCAAAATTLTHLTPADATLRKVARAQLERLHGEDTAASLVAGMRANPEGRGYMASAPMHRSGTVPPYR